jgi:hypothetical protein
MPAARHPRLHTRGPSERSASDGDLIRVLVYAPRPPCQGWVEAELQDRVVMVQIGFSVEHVVSALVEDPPPRPQILVVDFDNIGPVEIMQLHVLREQGWFGRIIALGSVPAPLRQSLAIDLVLCAPFMRDALRDAVTRSGSLTATTRLPVL